MATTLDQSRRLRIDYLLEHAAEIVMLIDSGVLTLVEARHLLGVEAAASSSAA